MFHRNNNTVSLHVVTQLFAVDWGLLLDAFPLHCWLFLELSYGQEELQKLESMVVKLIKF